MLQLNPGPVTLTERVRRSLLQPDLCHRESEFFDLHDDARRRLLDYPDLSRLARCQDGRGTPFTPSVHAYYALVEALREFAEQGGLATRPQRYAALAEQVRVGLAALGVDSVIPPGQSSVVLRSYKLPPGITYAALHDALKAGGFVIYAGQGDLSKTLFRISTMGNIVSADMERLRSCVAQFLA